VRELRNLVERCVLLADGDVFPERRLHLGDAPVSTATTGGALTEGDRLCLPLDGSLGLDAMERRILAEAQVRNGDNVSLTARFLGTAREKLRYRVQKYGLKTSD
jgi:two-component system response regulator AtoC